MRADSNLTKPERPAATATMSRVEPEDLTRLEGEGGRQVSAQQQSEDEGTMKISAWKEVVARYQKPSLARGVWQIVNTLVPYAALWYLMYLCLSVSWWITVPLAMLAGAFLVRMFIIHHDCGHGSFFKSRKANDIWGFITGVLTLTPYHHWRWEHSLHHATSGDLDWR
jgi:acyl-lipid omega-6 desaturase (Delta-12 desaturase)